MQQFKYNINIIYFIPKVYIYVGGYLTNICASVDESSIPRFNHCSYDGLFKDKH